jgi:hypothetical protein
MKAIFLSLTLLLGSCSTVSTLTEEPVITMAEYDQLKVGITQEAAEKIVGAKATELSQNEISGIKTIMVMWSNNGGISNANATFQNGKLISKAQLGLK